MYNRLVLVKCVLSFHHRVAFPLCETVKAFGQNSILGLFGVVLYISKARGAGQRVCMYHRYIMRTVCMFLNFWLPCDFMLVSNWLLKDSPGGGESARLGHFSSNLIDS